MNLEIINEETKIYCDNYNKNDDKAYDNNICVDCDSCCKSYGYLVKFIVNNEIIHQYERYESLDINDEEEILKLIEKLLNKNIKQIKEGRN